MKKHVRGVTTIQVIALLGVGAVGFVAWNIYEQAQQKAAIKRTAQAASQAMTDFRRARAQWTDSMTLATNTPRIGLATPIAKLQSIRQEAQAVPSPSCLQPSKDHLLTGMNAGIDWMMAFMRNDLARNELEELGSKLSQDMRVNFEKFEQKATACPKL